MCEENRTWTLVSGDRRLFSEMQVPWRYLKNITLTNGSPDSVFVEGTIGKLVRATFTEDIILEVIGKDGVLRIDLREDEIGKKTEQDQREVNG